VSFKSVKGQDAAVRLFRNSLKRDRIAGAYLFWGPRGVGKKLLAKSLAKALNCEKSLSDACDRCNSCLKIDKDNHPDVYWLRGEGKTNQVKIEQVRRLRDSIGLKPFEARRRVYVVDDAHLLTAEAGNALLKVLEEPPENSLFLLVSTDKSLLLPTIQSRCQPVRFLRLSSLTVEQILIESFNLEAGEAKSLARLCGGSPGRALQIKEQGYFEKRDKIVDALKSPSMLLGEGEWRARSREELFQTLDIIIEWCRDTLLLKFDLDAYVTNIDRREKILEFISVSEITENGLEGIIERALTTYRLIKANVNPRLAMEVFVSKLKMVFCL